MGSSNGPGESAPTRTPETTYRTVEAQSQAPASTAHTLARAWPDATLTICEDAAHISAQTDMLDAARRATDRFT